MGKIRRVGKLLFRKERIIFNYNRGILESDPNKGWIWGYAVFYLGNFDGPPGISIGSGGKPVFGSTPRTEKFIGNIFKKGNLWYPWTGDPTPTVKGSKTQTDAAKRLWGYKRLYKR